MAHDVPNVRVNNPDELMGKMTNLQRYKVV